MPESSPERLPDERISLAHTPQTPEEFANQWDVPLDLARRMFRPILTQEQLAERWVVIPPQPEPTLPEVSEDFLLFDN